MSKKTKSQKSPLQGMGVPLFFLGLACLMGFNVYSQMRMKNWPSTVATVVSVEKKVRNVSTPTGNKPGHHQFIRYTYSVDDKEFTSSEVSYGASLHQGVEWVENDKVPVYYNPNKPDEAVLVATDEGSTLFYIVSSVICLIIAWAMAVGLRSGRKA